MNPNKINVINVLKLISSREEQDRYEQNVPIAEVASELICQWFDDFFHPESEYFRRLFTKREWRLMCEFNKYFDDRVDCLPNSYGELKNDKNWHDIMAKASWVLTELGWDRLDTSSYDEDME